MHPQAPIFISDAVAWQSTMWGHLCKRHRIPPQCTLLVCSPLSMHACSRAPSAGSCTTLAVVGVCRAGTSPPGMPTIVVRRSGASRGPSAEGGTSAGRNPADGLRRRSSRPSRVSDDSALGLTRLPLSTPAHDLRASKSLADSQVTAWAASGRAPQPLATAISSGDEAAWTHANPNSKVCVLLPYMPTSLCIMYNVCIVSNSLHAHALLCHQVPSCGLANGSW